MAESNAEHRVILDAIRNSDPAAARAAGEAHIVGGKRRFLDAIGMVEATG
jgi:DNA-binding FadR family transcriptional regulator